MLSDELADKYYRERIYAESNKPDYTEEELRLQKERSKELDDYIEKLRREKPERLKSKHPKGCFYFFPERV